MGCLCYQYYELFVLSQEDAGKTERPDRPERLDQAQPKTVPTLVPSGGLEPDVEQAFRLARMAMAAT